MHSTVQISDSTTVPIINSGSNLEEYEEYVSEIDDICPFVSTASTGACLDEEIDKQKQVYDSLEKELFIVAGEKRTGLKGDGNVPGGIPTILGSVSEYSRVKDAQIAQMCSFRNSMELGSGIVETSRKCTMYYNAIDIQILKGIISELKRAIFPD